LITEGGTAPDGAFHLVSRFYDETICELFTPEVFSLLLRKKLIGHLRLSFQAERPSPPQVVQHEILMAAEEIGEYF